ncbi:MAG TPA: thioredoxin domain-containing protein [Longimicrobium sp.]|uniref:DsbA family protein n=1 Tax=Longimicrobium sp. TaxID=2029185 RepID=UPI002ED91554
MTRIPTPQPRHLRSLAAAGALLLGSALSTSACAQPGNGAAANRAASGVNADSVVARAERGRVKGPDSAPITIIEVSDFQCPYCREFATTTYPRLDSAYLRTGRAKLLYINLPLMNHRQAFAAAEAAMCAAAQDKFFAMHDRLFATQREWSGQADAAQRFEGYAQQLGLNMAEFRDCTQNDRTASLIVNDAMQAAGAGIQGTPMFILNGNGQQASLNGAVPFEQFQQAIDSLSSRPAAPAPQPGAPPAPRP